MNSYERIYNLLVETDKEEEAAGAAERAAETEITRSKKRGYGPNIVGPTSPGIRVRREVRAEKTARRAAARAVGTPTNDPSFVSTQGLRPGGRSPRHQHLRRTQVTR
tara:strand:- start:197 stop:517 length:321 start_codon:yes stop_codon:yes gene_type:complete